MNPPSYEIVAIPGAPGGLSFFATNDLAFGPTACVLAGAYADIRPEPFKTYSAGFLLGIGHGDSSSPFMGRSGSVSRGENRQNNRVAHFWQAEPVNISQAPKA
jgi:hypothetical protein